MTLGIGVNIAIFSVVNAVLLKPMAYDEPDSLVQPVNTNQGAVGGPAASPAKYMHWRAQTDVLEQRGGVPRYRSQSRARRTCRKPFAPARRRPSTSARSGRRSTLGRWFTAEEDLPNAGRTVVLGYNFWTQRMASDPDVVGKSVTLSGNPYTIVGVVGREFDFRDFGPAPEIFVPFQFDPNTTDQGHYFASAGRLKPGVTLEQAQARLQASAAVYRDRFAAAMPPNNGFSVITLQESLVRQARPALVVALGAVALVLLIACANVANLLLDPRHGAAPRDGRARRARGRALANRASAADREPDAVLRRRRSRIARGLSRHARAADGEYRWTAAARR